MKQKSLASFFSRESCENENRSDKELNKMPSSAAMGYSVGKRKKILESPVTPSSREAPASKKRSFSFENSESASASVSSNSPLVEDNWQSVELQCDKISRRLDFFEASGAGDLIGKAQVASQVTPWDGVAWLQPSSRRDGMGRKVCDENFDPRTIQVNTRGSKLSKTQEQYWEIKSKYADVVVFFKIGKFYELYEDDAEIGAKELNWKMTISGVGRCRQVGCPESGIEDAVQKLISLGYKVGRVEQAESSQEAKSKGRVVSRVLVEVCSRSTDTERDFGSLLSLREKIVNGNATVIGFARLNAFSGTIQCGTISDDDSRVSLEGLLTQACPAEILIDKGRFSLESQTAIKRWLSSGGWNTEVTEMRGGEGEKGLNDFLAELEKSDFSRHSISSLASKIAIADSTHQDTVCQALSCLVFHLKRMKQDKKLLGRGEFSIQHGFTAGCMKMDGASLQNLHLLRGDTNQKKGSLLGFLDVCVSVLGKRLLRKWIVHPLQCVKTIELRQEVVSLFVKNTDLLSCTRTKLGRLEDIEKAIGKLRALQEKPIKIEVPMAVKRLKQTIRDSILALSHIKGGFGILEEIQGMDESISGCFLMDFNPFLRKPETIDSVNSLAMASKKLQELLCELEESPDREQISAIEEAVSDALGRANANGPVWTELSGILARTDILQSFASVVLNSKGPMCIPTISDRDNGPCLQLEGVWHPLITSKVVVPSDINLGDGQKLSALITGPNMGGKSTALRSACIAVLLGQMGSFVPAQSAHFTLVDAVFTRLGARDNIMCGESTFNIECLETSSLLRQATSKSLVILDELGRGTSTFDGYALAYATFRFITDRLKCRCLFSTHYQYLTKEFENSAFLGHMAFMENDADKQISFLYRLAEGVSKKSYGLEIARMAGIPEEILRAARRKSEWMENVCSFSGSTPIGN